MTLNRHKYRALACPPPPDFPAPVPLRAKSLLIRAAIILLFVALPLSASGRVFLSRLLGRGMPALETMAGWRQIYQCPVTLNSAGATMFVYGCDEALDSAEKKLHSVFAPKNEIYASAGQGMAWMIGRSGGRFVRLLALAMPAADKTVVFALVQSPAEFARSTSVPAQSAIFGGPTACIGRLAVSIKNEETGAILESMSTETEPGRLAGEIAETLSRQGWEQILPDGETFATGVPPGYFLMFQRSRALCTVMIGRALNANGSCVTFFYKEIAATRGSIR